MITYRNDIRYMDFEELLPYIKFELDVLRKNVNDDTLFNMRMLRMFYAYDNHNDNLYFDPLKYTHCFYGYMCGNHADSAEYTAIHVHGRIEDEYGDVIYGYNSLTIIEKLLNISATMYMPLIKQAYNMLVNELPK